MLLLCLHVALIAAPLDVQTRTMVRVENREPLKLPFVAGTGVVPERINTVVYMTLLSAAPPTAEGVLAESDDSKWFASLEFTTPRNDERLIELAFDGETCGAYCEPFTRSLAFDARTGRSITLPDIITTQGMDLIGQRMKAERVRLYREQVRQLSRIKDRHSALADRISFNKECLDYENRHASLVESMAASFTTKGLTVRSERCSDHTTRSLDDVGDVTITVRYGDLVAAMTPYGKALLIGGGDATALEDPFGQALRGNVGTAAVTAVLERPSADGSFNGHYFYDKHRKPIPLRGHRNADGTIQMTESVDTVFSLTARGASLLGTWSGHGRTLEVHLSF